MGAYDQLTEHDRVERELATYLAELIDSRRTMPGDDLVSARIDAEELTDNELLSTARGAAAGPVTAPGCRGAAAPIHQPGQPCERPIYHRGRGHRRRRDPGR